MRTRWRFTLRVAVNALVGGPLGSERTVLAASLDRHATAVRQLIQRRNTTAGAAPWPTANARNPRTAANTVLIRRGPRTSRAPARPPRRHRPGRVRAPGYAAATGRTTPAGPLPSASPAPSARTRSSTALPRRRRSSSSTRHHRDRTAHVAETHPPPAPDATRRRPPSSTAHPRASEPETFASPTLTDLGHLNDDSHLTGTGREPAAHQDEYLPTATVSHTPRTPGEAREMCTGETAAPGGIARTTPTTRPPTGRGARCRRGRRSRPRTRPTGHRSRHPALAAASPHPCPAPAAAGVRIPGRSPRRSSNSRATLWQRR